MLRRRRFEMEVRVGIFVTLGIGLVMAAIVLLGGIENIVTRHHTYITYYNNVDGLMNGSKIILNGIRIGTVEGVQFDKERREIRVDMQVGEKFEDWIRVDTIAEIQTQGVLGDKYIALDTITLDQPILPPGSEIKTKSTGNLKRFIDSGETLMSSLNSIAASLDRVLKSFERKGRNEILFEGLAKTADNLSHATDKLNAQLDDIKLKESIAHLNGILTKVDNGKGTIGALINDPSLYDDIKLLFGGANRNRVIRNLIRQTVKEGKEKDQAAE